MAFGLSGSLSACFMYIFALLCVFHWVANKDACLHACLLACVTLSGFLHSHIIRCRWNPISRGTHYSGHTCPKTIKQRPPTPAKTKTGKPDRGAHHQSGTDRRSRPPAPSPPPLTRDTNRPQVPPQWSARPQCRTGHASQTLVVSTYNLKSLEREMIIRLCCLSGVWWTLPYFIPLLWAGHNTDGKYFVTNSKLGFSCETRPRRVIVFIEKTRDGIVSAVTDVEVRDVVCGANHVVSWLFVQFLPHWSSCFSNLLSAHCCSNDVFLASVTSWCALTILRTEIFPHTYNMGIWW